jgi:hypothetical protein
MLAERVFVSLKPPVKPACEMVVKYQNMVFEIVLPYKMLLNDRFQHRVFTLGKLAKECTMLTLCCQSKKVLCPSQHLTFSPEEIRTWKTAISRKSCNCSATISPTRARPPARLAMRPKLAILDEPATGIDAMGETGKGFGIFIMVVGIIETVALLGLVFFMQALR